MIDIPYSALQIGAHKKGSSTAVKHFEGLLMHGMLQQFTCQHLMMLEILCGRGGYAFLPKVGLTA